MKLGEYQELYYVKKVDFGVYLAEDLTSETHVLLPAKQVPENAKTGEKIRVEKDLFLPYKEMTSHVEAGDEVLVTLYIDKSTRLCASMKGLYDLLSKDSPYKKDDTVTGRVYEFSDNFGTFVAVDDKYSARIPVSEDHSFLKVGDVIEAKITAVKPDGKLDLTLREKAYIQMDADAQKILELLDSYAGVLPFSEKASPEVIKRETGLSKAAFKRAIGRLYKERKITLDGGKIRKN